jgi:DNA modification methylase
MISYAGDKPNPELRSFVERGMRGRPFDPSGDDRQRSEFTRTIETTRNSHVFRMHGYHLGKKPHDAVEAYIEHYTEPGDLVLDPFCGSGSTALAALIRGRRAVAIDASPAATFITRFYLSPCDPDDLERRFRDLCESVSRETEHLYRTTCHRCGSPATIHYVIYSNLYRCPACARKVTLYEASLHTPPRCPHCSRDHSVRAEISSSMPIEGNEPVAVNFSCTGPCRPRRITRSCVGPDGEAEAFREIDLARIEELERVPIPYPVPDRHMMDVTDPAEPWGDEWRPSRNFRTLSDLFTYRNLHALAALFHAASGDDDLRAILTSGMLAVSRKAQHLSRGGGYIPGNWALPPMSKQRNVFESLAKVFTGTLKAKRILARMLRSRDACISTQDARSLAEIPSESVDYVFTDPPYGGAVQYGELNFIWETWLGCDTDWRDGEIIVNRTRNRTEKDWADGMSEAIAECYRVLKPGRRLSICYHHASSAMWEALQNVMADAGFLLGTSGRASVIDTGSNTYNQRVTDKLVKRDLVLNFRKPGSGEARPIRPKPRPVHDGFTEPATRIIGEYLSANPGSPGDRIYDHLVSVLVPRGQMKDHDFMKLLNRIARREGGKHSRWYLKD